MENGSQGALVTTMATRHDAGIRIRGSALLIRRTKKKK
jgi:hypothetical protein